LLREFAKSEDYVIIVIDKFIKKNLLEVLFMKLSAPKVLVFWISVALAAVALLMAIGVLNISFVGAVWVALAAFVLLGLGNILKGF